MLAPGLFSTVLAFAAGAPAPSPASTPAVPPSAAAGEVSSESRPVAPTPKEPSESAPTAATAPGAKAEPETRPAEEKRPIPLSEAVIIDPPTMTGAPGEKRFIELRGKAVSLALGAALQVRLASAAEAPGITLGAARFLLDVKAEELLDLSLHLQLELNPLVNTALGTLPDFLPDPQTIFPLADAFISFSLASAAVGNLGYLVMGQFKVPFSREALTDKTALMTVERSWVIRAHAPFRDVGFAYGADFHGYGIPVAAEVGVFNGAGPSSLEELNNLLGAARVFGHAGPASNRTRFRFEYGLSWSMEASRLDPLTGEPDSTTLLGADLMARWRWFTVAAEILVASTRSANRGFEAYGGYAYGAVQLIPDFLELIGRYERYVADIASVQSGERRAAWRVTAGANLYYLDERFRLQYSFHYGDEGNAPPTDIDPEHVVLFTIRM